MWNQSPYPGCYIHFTDWSHLTFMDNTYTYHSNVVSNDEYNNLKFSPEYLQEFINKLWLVRTITEDAVHKCDTFPECWHPYWYAWDVKALRYNFWKTRWSLVHFPSLEPMVEVLEYWSKKYAEENWKKAMDKKQILESLMRHLVRLMEDEELDSESWLPHVWHILANCMFYSYHSTLWKK